MSKKNLELQLPRNLCIGERKDADYHEPEIPEHGGNPLLETLPYSLTKGTLREKLQNKPPHTAAHRVGSIQSRSNAMAAAFNEFFQPLLRHVRLEQGVSIMLRRGYIGRNPMALQYYEELDKRAKKVDGKVVHPGTIAYATPTALLTGMSGAGKSYSLERILKLTPQVYTHTLYHEQPFTHKQLVWLKMDCPSSPRALCTTFFQIVDHLLGTDYLEKYWGNNGTVGTMVPGLARVALLHSLGLLVLDEAQNLRLKSSGGTEQLTAFIRLIENTLGVPVLLVGNARVSDLFSKEFSLTRRGTGLLEPHWFRMLENSKDWKYFLASVWEYQYTATETKLTDILAKEMYYQTQGVADYVVKLYQAVQLELMNRGEDEVITPEIIARVGYSAFSESARVLKALRERDLTVLKETSDISLIDLFGDDLPPSEIDRLARAAEEDAKGNSRNAKPKGKGKPKPGSETPEEKPKDDPKSDGDEDDEEDGKPAK